MSLNIYMSLGVSADKPDVHRAVRSLNKGMLDQGFCRVCLQPGGVEDEVAVLHTDGVGTKGLIAWLAWKESGDLNHFRGLGQDAIVMNTDDMLCVGCTGPFLLTNCISRNRDLVPGEVLETLVEGFQETIAGLASQGIEIVHCGGETEDMQAVVRTLAISCSLYSRMPAQKLIDTANIQPGDVIVGIASRLNEADSGIGCNGLTLARHALLHPSYQDDWPDALGKDAPSPVGRYRLSDPLPDTNLSVAQALLSPTQSYLPMLANVLSQTPDIHGAIHCTGGGQTKILKFGSGLRYIKHSPLSVPPIFRHIQEGAGVCDKEMYRVFNMGCRMEVICTPQAAGAVLSAAEEAGVPAAITGRVEENETPNNTTGNSLRIETPTAVLEY